MISLNRQQLCVALSISESTVRRLEQSGLPYTPVGKRSKRYDLDECKAWLRANPPSAMTRAISVSPSKSFSEVQREFVESCKKVNLRVMPSEK